MAATSDDRHYLEEELIELFQTTPDVLEFLDQGSLDGMWYWDVDRQEEEWMSPRFREVFGYTQDEIPNTSQWWQENIHPDDLAVALENFEKHLADPKHPYDQVVRYQHKDGSMVYVRCRGLAIRDENGRARRLLGVHTDVTSLKEAELELQRKNEALEQFVYMASHDMREPLRAVTGFADVLAEILTPEPGSETAEVLAHLRSGATRMQELLDDLLLLSRIDRGGAPASVNVNDMVQEVLLDIAPLLEAHDTDVRVTIDPGLTVRATPGHVRSLLQNLITNAAKFHPADRGNTVQVTVGTGETVEIVVEDDGVGIDPEDHERIMEPFVRLPGTSSTPGTGIGLAGVAKIVAAGNGQYSIDSGLESGATFRIEMPAWAEDGNADA